MQVGAAQFNITPEPGVELSGFLMRRQPSTAVDTPIFAKALYLRQGERCFLWIHADLLALSRDFVSNFRAWAQQRLGLESSQVMVSATHTHCGPATLALNLCGEVEERYLGGLGERLKELALSAAGALEPCRLVFGEGHLVLAVDRRRKTAPLTDPRVGAVGWQREDGTFAAAAVVYSMHAVALGAVPLISADWPGEASNALRRELPGEPVVLISTGASGNVNPPQVGVPPERVRQWGRQVAQAAREPLLQARPVDEPEFATASRVLPLPLEQLSPDQVDDRAAALLKGKPDNEFQRRFKQAVELWRTSVRTLVAQGEGRHVEAELQAVRLGPVTIVGLNAEAFVHLVPQIREFSGRNVYVVGCANGVFGYLPHEVAYDEGGYEVDSSFVFYNTLRPRRGGLEWLAREAASLVLGL